MDDEDTEDITIESLAAEMTPAMGDDRAVWPLPALIAKFRELLDKYGCDYSDELVAAAAVAYAAICRQVDIPHIPEFVEQRLEEAIWKWLEKGLNAIIDEMCL